jgi:hypothetical protein
MKFRLTILVIVLSLALAACSLAEDITPPPGYVSPTSLPPTAQATLTPQSLPSSTPAPATETVSSAATIAQSTDSSTPSADVSPTPQPALVVVGGLVSGFPNSVIPHGATVSLMLYNTTLGQVMDTLTSPVHSDGKYEFTDVSADTTTVFLVTTDYGGVTYDSVPAKFDGSTLKYDLPVTIYDSTSDQNLLSVTQVHLQFDFTTAGEVKVMALYVVSNPGTTSVIIPSDGSTVPFIQVPAGATNTQYQLSQNSSPLMSATGGFALLPGTDKQYGIIATFSLPYTNRLVFAQPFSLPVKAAAVIVPEGVKVRSDQLTDGGTQGATGSTYHIYQASSLASGSTLTITISGKPGDKPGFVLDQRTWIMIGVGFLGLLLVGLGVFLFLRDRRLGRLEQELEQEAETAGPDALGEDRESIMDAIIALDDQFKAGDISKEAYEKRRDELKERLKNLA